MTFNGMFASMAFAAFEKVCCTQEQVNNGQCTPDPDTTGWCNSVYITAQSVFATNPTAAQIISAQPMPAFDLIAAIVTFCSFWATTLWTTLFQTFGTFINVLLCWNWNKLRSCHWLRHLPPDSVIHKWVRTFLFGQITMGRSLVCWVANSVTHLCGYSGDVCANDTMFSTILQGMHTFGNCVALISIPLIIFYVHRIFKSTEAAQSELSALKKERNKTFHRIAKETQHAFNNRWNNNARAIEINAQPGTMLHGPVQLYDKLQEITMGKIPSEIELDYINMCLQQMDKHWHWVYGFIQETKGYDEMFFDNHESLVRGLREYLLDQEHWQKVLGYQEIHAKYCEFVQTDRCARKVKERLQNT